jgi:hypothetical protein
MGWIFIILGIIIAAAGFMLEKKYHKEATSTASFGMPRITIGGILNYLGWILLIFGLCCAMVGAMIQFA